MSDLKEFRKSISVETGAKRKKSFREIVFRILTIPVFLAGISWYWIRMAFEKGYEWEQEEIEKWWMIK